MGWRDQSTPADAQPNTSSAPAPAAASPSAPAAAPQSGWKTQSTPADEKPNTVNSPAPAVTGGSGPKPGEPGNETLPWFSMTGPDKVGAWVNSAIDSATMGGADYLQGKLNENLGGSDLAKKFGIADPSQNVDALRKNTENLRGDIGPVGSLTADLAGAAFGPIGEVGAGARLAARIAPKIAKVVGERAAPIISRMAGAGAENAAVSAGGTVGHGGSWEDAGKSAEVGGLLGTLTGAIPGGRGARAGEASPTPVLEAGEKAAFGPLSGVHYDPADVAVHFDPVTSKLSSGDRVALGGSTLKSAADDVSKELMTKYNNGQTVTASDIAKFKATLMSKATNDTEMRVAGDYGRSLDAALSSKTPLKWGSVTPGTNMLDKVNAANQASSKAKSSADIDDWIKSAQGGDYGVPNDVGKSLKATNFFNAEPATRPLLQQAADWKPSSWGQAGRVAGEKLAGFGIGAGTDYLAGDDHPWIAGAAAAGLTHGLGSVIPRGAPNSLIERLGQARAANATGNPGFRPDFNPGARMGFGPLITYGRRGFPGIGASGAFDPNNPQASGQP